jgi:DNA repair exonuclease SbcCD ATPase subunit
MKFTELKIENFLTIGEATLNLKDRGLVLIQGVNDDDTSANSNGVGKSSVADALCWALFGITARGETTDAIVNNVRKKNCAVSVTIEDNATVYRVTRFRKHATHKNKLMLENQVGSFWNDMTLGTDRETQALIEKVIGCTHDVFAASIYSGQEGMPDLPAMTDKNLKVIIEKASGTERLEKAYEIARTKRNNAQVEFDRQSSCVKTGQESALKAMERIKELLVLRDTWNTDMANKIAATISQEANHKLELAKQNAIVVALDEVGLRKSLERAEHHMAEFNESRVTCRIHEQTITEHRRKIGEIDRQEVVLEGQLNGFKTTLSHAASATCHACHKPHTQEEIDKIKAETEPLMIETAKAVIAKRAERKAIEEKIEQVQVKIAEIDAMPKPESLMAEIKEINTKLEGVAAAQRPLLSMVQAIRNATAEIETLKATVNPYTALLAKEKEQAVESLAAKVKAEKALVEAQTALEVAEDVVKVFGPAGVRAQILDTVTPFLNERTSEYLSTLSDGNITAIWSTLTLNKSGEVKEKFSIDVEHSKGGKSFGLLSGGEKRKVRLAAMLALQDLVASRATKPIDLFVGDEIDDALDHNGLERLMTILERRARERGTVLVISHNELRDWVDNVAVVTKSGGLSRIEGALSV